MDFSIWAFTASDTIASRWHATVNQMPSASSSSDTGNADAKQEYQTDFTDGIGRVSLGCLDANIQLWVLEASGQFSPIFHWLLRYYGATCIPKSAMRDTCCTTMFASELHAEGGGFKAPLRGFKNAETSPRGDLSILSDTVEESGRLGYEIQVGESSTLFITDDVHALGERGDVTKELSKCTDSHCDLQFNEIWKYR